MTSVTRDPSPVSEGNNPPLLPALGQKSSVPALAGIALCLLMAVGQIAIANYKLGIGNQAIQIAFLERAADPSLFSADRMVVDTMPLYPSYFFRMLAPLLRFTDVATLYLILQILTSFLTLSSVYWLSRSIFRSHAAGLAAAGVLVAGHLHALAGDTLYSQGFTHTFAALPLAIGALALAYRGKWLWAFAVAGVLFNIHALTSAYVLLMLAAALLADVRSMPPWRWALRALLCVDIALVLAAPTLMQMAHTRQVFDADWINLMRVRSADHSFPSTWWASTNPDIPRFVLFFALFVLSWSFSPVRRGFEQIRANEKKAQDKTGGPRWSARVTMLMTAAVLLLFALGYLFSEVWPTPLMIRLQPFRASRLLMILMLVHIAYGAIAAIRAAASGKAQEATGQTLTLSLPARFAELVAGVVTLATLGIPALLSLLPCTLLVVLLAALIVGHLSWRQSTTGVMALLIALLAWCQIDFPLAPFSSWVSAGGGMADVAGVASLGWLALFSAIMLVTIVGLLKNKLAQSCAITVIFIFGGLLSLGLFGREQQDSAMAGGADFDKVAAWARDKTPKAVLFLTPSGYSNFRIDAERSLVGDWRDGTQLYFSARFGPEWLAGMAAIEPGTKLSPDGKTLEMRGDSLDTLTDQELVDLAKKSNANYILLPTPKQKRNLVAAFSDSKYTVFEPRLPQPAIALPPRTPPSNPIPITPRSPPGNPITLVPRTPPSPNPITIAPRIPPSNTFDPGRTVGSLQVPEGVINPAAWNEMENFMATTVQQNIEKYRKADVTIEMVDSAGHPITDLSVKLDQTQQAFVFGGSLGYFESMDLESPEAHDLDGPPVRPIELEKFPEVFNGSMIPFSAKWAAIEPQRGVYRWDDLDKYVDYCTQHDITMEFHHLTGVRPEWVAQMGGPGGQEGLYFGRPDPVLQEDFNRHCLAVLDRYHDKIKYFQVVNEKYMMQYVPAAWKLLKAKYPKVQFGLSDCVNFWMPGISARSPDFERDEIQYKGFDAIKWLQNQGIQPDFFSAHGHHPNNLWADPRDMYAVLDRFQQAGVRVHVSEEYLRINSTISGPVRRGILTPELQAECFVRYFTVLFSHPDVDMVNIWGAMAYSGWTNTGLIDPQGKPLPAFYALKKLFNETWRSHVSSQLPTTGILKSRVFHGKYQLSVTLPDGRVISAALNVPQEKEAHFKVTLDATKGALTVE